MTALGEFEGAFEGEGELGAGAARDDGRTGPGGSSIDGLLAAAVVDGDELGAAGPGVEFGGETRFPSVERVMGFELGGPLHARVDARELDGLAHPMGPQNVPSERL